MEIGISSFAEITPDPTTGAVMSPAQRAREVVEEIALADEVGLDVYGLGEHHRADFVSSAPAVILAAAAERTSRIRLTSAVTVLSSDDPVRVFQDFATLDGLSQGRAEVMAGRGSFIESFPLFGLSLDDYDELFAEKLDLLLTIRDDPERVTWSGRHRAALRDQGVAVRQGDVVLIHTGWVELLERDPARFGKGEPGIDNGAAEFLARLGGVAVGADTWGVEAVPFKNPNRVWEGHQTLLARTAPTSWR